MVAKAGRRANSGINLATMNAFADTPEERRALMRRVRPSGSRVERTVRSAIHARGLRFRLHRRDLPGTPDLVFPRHRLVVFVHGCFWHRHAGCGRATTPKTHHDYWMEKFEDNVRRDRRKQEALEALGWRVAVVWECQALDSARLKQRLDDIFEGENAGTR